MDGISEDFFYILVYLRNASLSKCRNCKKVRKHRQHRRSTLFTCLCPISLFTHLCEIFLKRIACLLNHQFQKGATSVSISPGLFLPPPLYLSMPPPINPSLSWRLPVPICTLLVTLSTYLVLTECLCNQTYTYPVVRHSNGQLIMKLHRCELTTV